LFYYKILFIKELERIIIIIIISAALVFEL